MEYHLNKEISTKKDIIKEIVLKNSDDGDAIMWGDLDEVPNPDVVQKNS